MLRLILVGLAIIASKEVFKFLGEVIIMLAPQSDICKTMLLIMLIVLSFCYLIGREG